MTGVKRRLRRADADRRPEVVWNAFVDLLAQEEFADLSPTQRIAHLVFWYDSEVQNGGHDQYFDNIGIGKARETIPALHALGLDCLAAVLRSAIESAELKVSASDNASRRSAVHSLIRWLKLVRGVENRSELNPHDAAYHRCSPTITEALETYLARNGGEFIEYDS